MTDSIRIDTGEKRIMVNDDPERLIVFNPSDVAFAERFYQLLRDFEAKEVEYTKRADELSEDGKLDEHGVPANMEDGLALLRDICEWLREKIDNLFGKGTSQAAFGDALSLEAFEQFFAGVTPFVKAARSEKMTRYVSKKMAGRVMKGS